MERKIVWTKTAFKTFQDIADYLEKQWSLKIAKNFVANTEKKLEQIKENPESCIASNKDKTIRKATITKHNSMFYRVKENALIILAFFDNRKNPKKNKYS
jgi:plasmid stabilization system protein ParE